MVQIRPDRPERQHRRRVFTCDHCGREIDTPRGVYLLRDLYALPEEPTFFLHADCVDAFTKTRIGRWNRIPATSPEASWSM